MWFKNLRLYRLNKPLEVTPEELHELLEPAEFQPCGKQEPQRAGWVPPLGRHGSLFVHAVGKNLMVALRHETRILPSAVVKEHLEQKVAEIREEEGRPVGRKERETIKEEIVFSLMPRAFTKSSITFGYLALDDNMIVINAGSAQKAEELLSLLRDAVGALSCVPLAPNESPVFTMTGWLREQGASGSFALGEECELSAPKDGRIIKCKNQDLTAEEVINHIDAGMVVSKLALTWKESVQFVLDDEFNIKRLKFEDTLKEKAEADTAETAAQAFDQEFAVMAVEVNGLVNELLEAFGGE